MTSQSQRATQIACLLLVPMFVLSGSHSDLHDSAITPDLNDIESVSGCNQRNDMADNSQPNAKTIPCARTGSSCAFGTRKNTRKCRCTRSALQFNVDCSHMNLTAIPRGFPNDTTRLVMKGNWLINIPPFTFASYEKLQELDLSDNHIVNVCKESLYGLISLRNLTLRANHIQWIDSGSFSMLRNIHTIDLSNNTDLTFKSLRNISNDLNQTSIAILNLTSLHKTDVDANCVELRKGDLETFNGTSLHTLILDSNRLQYVDISALTVVSQTLEILSMRNNKMDFTNAWRLLLPLTNLKMFIIAGQNINNIQRRSVRSLPKLRGKVNIEGNSNRSAIEGKSTVNEFTPANVDPAMADYKKAPTTAWNRSSQNIKTPTTVDQYNVTHQGMLRKRTASPTLCSWLPLNLEYVDASDQNLRMEVGAACFMMPNTLKVLKLNRNTLWKMYGPIKGLRNLTDLDISMNSCTYLHETILYNFPKLRKLNMSKNFLGQLFSQPKPIRLFWKSHSMTELDLSYNHIARLPATFFKGLKNLQVLTLANNRIDTLEDINMAHMSHLKDIELQNNDLRTLGEGFRKALDEIRKRNNVRLNLSGNDLRCTCDDRDFIAWFQTTKVTLVNKHTYTCKDDAGDTYNLTLNIVDVHANLKKKCADYAVLIAVTVSAFIIILIIIIAGILYRYRWDLRYMYYSAKVKVNHRTARNAEEVDYKYDMFVSYHDTDGIFIRNQLVPELEDKRGVRLLLHERDFLVGRYVTENIMHAIKMSAKVLIIMTHSYLESKWCCYEMNLARMEAINTGRDILCVVLKEKVPTKCLPLEIMDILRHKTYLELPTEPDHLKQFWDRLKSSMPQNETSA